MTTRVLEWGSKIIEPSVLLSNWYLVLIAGIFFYIVFEQINLQVKRQGLPGPKSVWPFIGSIVHLVKDPFTYWDVQETYGPISWNSILGKTLIFCRDNKLTREVFQNNTPETLRVSLHPNAGKLLGENNIAFMQGESHKELRKRLLPLFTKRALSVYVTLQEALIREHIDRWLKLGQPVEMRPLCRDLNVETSQNVFLGPYLSGPEKKEFADNYMRMNEGFLCFPISFPGTTLYKAIQARKKVVEMLSRCAGLSKKRMLQGEEPSCLLDFWMEGTVKEIQEAEKNGAAAPPHSTDFEVASTVLDFLFASQDASTASLVWTTALLESHPDLLARVRAEQMEIRPNDEPVTPDSIAKMETTRLIMKEILRFRPPATMVPHVALHDTKLSNDIVAPKGSIVVPSVWCSSFQGFTNPEKFDPDRFNKERQEDVHYKKYFLTFGVGPHLCLGKEYAMNHICAYIAIMARNIDWVRHKTDISDTIVYGPTIYPHDCLVTMKRRQLHSSAV